MDSAGARMGLYIAFLLLGVFYTCLGLRFNGYLNRFIGTYVVVVVVAAKLYNNSLIISSAKNRQTASTNKYMFMPINIFLT